MTDIEKVIEQVALKNATTPEEVHKEIEYAIRVAMSDPDPKVKSFWKEIPHEDTLPTVEEVLIFLTQKVACEF